MPKGLIKQKTDRRSHVALTLPLSRGWRASETPRVLRCHQRADRRLQRFVRGLATKPPWTLNATAPPSTQAGYGNSDAAFPIALPIWHKSPVMEHHYPLMATTQEQWGDSAGQWHPLASPRSVGPGQDSAATWPSAHLLIVLRREVSATLPFAARTEPAGESCRQGRSTAAPPSSRSSGPLK